MPKFFVRQNAIHDGIISITGDDAYHISRALRMAKGEKILVSDMQSNEYECALVGFSEDGGCVEAGILSVRHAENEPPLSLSLYQALPKGDKLDTVIQKSVECGVCRIIPFESERCIVRKKPELEEKKTERRNRISLEAAKQCGRSAVPPVLETVSFDEMLKKATGDDLCLFCYEGETDISLRDVLQNAKAEGKIRSLSIVIGSEGGFSLAEAEKLKAAGAISVSLGKRILRTETAAAFVLGCIVYEYELSWHS